MSFQVEKLQRNIEREENGVRGDKEEIKNIHVRLACALGKGTSWLPDIFRAGKMVSSRDEHSGDCWREV